MPHYDLISYANDTDLAGGVAERWLNALAARPNARAPYCVALSGGRIAGKFMAAVSGQARARNVLFDNVHFFWGDERCVPPNDAESNFLLAKAHLLDPLAIRPDQIHRIRGEIAPDAAAAEAEAEICRIAPMNTDGQPALDLIFLGMGEDGHVASLFPGAPAEEIGSEPVYRPVVAVKPPPRRITINFATIAAAREVWVLASGAGKETALRKSLSPDGDTPLAGVLGERDRTIIFTDIAL